MWYCPPAVTKDQLCTCVFGINCFRYRMRVVSSPAGSWAERKKMTVVIFLTRKFRFLVKSYLIFLKILGIHFQIRNIRTFLKNTVF